MPSYLIYVFCILLFIIYCILLFIVYILFLYLLLSYIPILMYFLLFILLSENNAIANFRGESRHNTVPLHNCLRPRVQRHKNFTHCRVMNIMATNGISSPLATNSLSSRFSFRAIGTQVHTDTNAHTSAVTALVDVH